MDSVYKNIEEKYIKKIKLQEPKKMKRNLQPEIEKIKSINKSLMDLGYISEEENLRLRREVEVLLNNLANHR